MNNLPHISRAVHFKSSLTKQVKVDAFNIEIFDNDQIIALCRTLTKINMNKKFDNLYELLINSKMIFGSKDYIKKEVERVASSKISTYKGLLLSFPFKCPVPIKTNYHISPDLGELIYLCRLGNLSQLIEKHLGSKFYITILEESEALSRVFNISLEECITFQRKLKNYLKVLELSEIIKIKSLSKEIDQNYNASFMKEVKIIKNNLSINKKLIDEVLPTIALSVNTNNLSLQESQDFIKKTYIQNGVNNSVILETAVKFTAFTNLLTKSNVRYKKYHKYLQLSISSKKGRIAIMPTDSKILPHHGVPIVVYKKQKILEFKIMYFIDFINKYQNKKYKIVEVQTLEADFLFYKVT